MTEPMMPGAKYAMNVIHPGSPALRIRYRAGVLVDPYGFPDWLLYARGLVELAPVPTDLTTDEIRVSDVLAANLAMAGTDPLFPADSARSAGSPDESVPDPAGSIAVATPPGWCWAHLSTADVAERRLALVPVELHASYRHGGGRRLLPFDPERRGLTGASVPVPLADGDEVPAEVLVDLERLLGFGLPPAYRDYLGRTNGAGPTEPGVLAGHGFLLDAPLFGLGRTDAHQDLSFIGDWLTDRFAPDLLAIGYLQGGLLAVSVTGAAADTVWYWDDDDPRDDAGFDPAFIRERLLYPCAPNIDAFFAALRRPPAALLDRAAELVRTGVVHPIGHELAGSALPPALRSPWQPKPAKRTVSVAGLFEAR